MGYRKHNPDGPSSEDKALDLFAEMMIQKIEEIKKDWRKPWFTDGALTWPKNMAGREYNGLNALMLLMHCEKQGYKIPRFCTFDAVTRMNGKTDKEGNDLPRVSVLRGEKSFPVMLTTFTCIDKETKEKIKYEDYKKLSEEEQKRYNVYPKMQVFRVFNVDQTNLKESRPELYEKLARKSGQRKAGQPGEEFSFEPVDRMMQEGKWVCPIRQVYQNDAYYSISKDEIVVPEKAQFKDGESFYGTLFHEMTHSTGAESRLGRIKPAAFGSDDYAREELVAELGSALVAQRYGMSRHLKEDSAAYLKSWLGSLKESPQFIKTTLLDVKKATSMMTQCIDRITQELEQGTKEKQGAQEQGKMFYSSVAYLQSTDDTSRLDALKDKGDYDGLLKLAKEYYDGNGMDEKYTFRSPLQNKGDDLLIEDKDFAVVYNGSVGGTYEVMLKFTEEEVRDHIRRYGTGRASEDVKEVAKDMVAEEFSAMSDRRMPVLEMENGEVLHLQYNRDMDCIEVGTAANAGLAVLHSFEYDHGSTLESNLQEVNARLSEMEEYKQEQEKAAYSSGGGWHR
ncbi:MAG TPA: DUF1738 domain-containing protein [Candidatus Bacteroides pullicola]|uniref:DUF1738 domain-containing protein n=1 Tax=Candidatus Bacteroides pullicola TaxID=2838475 RepID=A0A9D2CKC8_9BACE|nr:DUF1738 domain-containing protein [Candidatus Bacteroides pullicola]